MRILNRLVIFLIRLKLHLKKGQKFQFDNQKTDAVYWFTEGALMKMENPSSPSTNPVTAAAQEEMGAMMHTGAAVASIR